MHASTWSLISLLALAACGGNVASVGPDPGPADSGSTHADGGSTPPSTGDASTLPTPTPTPCGHTAILCLTDTLEWHPDGGFVSSTSKSTLVGCGSYTHSVDDQAPMQPKPTCTQTVLACSPDGLDQDAVQNALADADVVAALAKAPILFGTDSRPTDGQIFLIKLGDKEIDVGGPCSSAPDCKDIPLGVEKLASLLKSIDAAQLMIGECGQVFHGK